MDYSILLHLRDIFCTLYQIHLLPKLNLRVFNREVPLDQWLELHVNSY